MSEISGMKDGRNRRAARPFVHGRASSLPSIDQFVASDEAEAIQPLSPSGESDHWEEQEWSGFNWDSAASLAGDPEEAERADSDWSATEWESRSEAKSMPASSVAAALDRVAQRIRSGELPVAAYAGISPEGAIAAALAALLRERR